MTTFDIKNLAILETFLGYFDCSDFAGCSGLPAVSDRSGIPEN
jgi:hypothetical protein